jgi:hypothetical protein
LPEIVEKAIILVKFNGKRRRFMPNGGDWLPTRREAQLAMAQNWVTVLGNQSGNPWNIPTADVTELQSLTSSAQILLEQAQSSARTPVITAEGGF